MSQFNPAYLDEFLGTVRKYMEVRGSLSQKELAELTEIGVSTMSRFLNRKTADLNPQLIATIVARLEIPLHEIIDFIEEEYSDKFIRLVKFYRNDGAETQLRKDDTYSVDQVKRMRTEDLDPSREKDPENSLEDEFAGALGTGGTARRSASAKVSAGGGRKRTLTFDPDDDHPHSHRSIKEKLASLSPRQKAYMTDFLDLDMEGRDLIVDLGNSLFRYFRQKGMQL